MWVAADDLRIRLHTHIEGGVRHLDDREAAREFRSRVPVAGAEVGDYLPRLITVGRDEVLASVRFRGGLPSGCFVELYAATTPLGAGALLRDVAHAVAAQWKVFRPRSLRIHHAHELPPSEIGGLKSLEIDHVVYAA